MHPAHSHVKGEVIDDASETLVLPSLVMLAARDGVTNPAGGTFSPRTQLSESRMLSAGPSLLLSEGVPGVRSPQPRVAKDWASGSSGSNGSQKAVGK